VRGDPHARFYGEGVIVISSPYPTTKVVSLAGALEPEAIAQYSKRATGQKYLIDPTRA
jgi:hypothetical protein